MDRSTETSMPRGMYFKHGRYYRVVSIEGRKKWIPLSPDLDESLKLFELSRAGIEMERPLRTRQRIDEGAYRDSVLAHLPRAMNNARRSASARRLKFDIDIPTLQRIAKASRFRCAVTNIRFSGMGVGSTRQQPYVPSLDRIECTGDYVEGNCRLVLAAVNTVMNQWGEGVLATMAFGYAELHKRRMKSDAVDTAGRPC